jgi:hypothetical protein
MNNNLNPNFLSGFVDAEGCFHISIVDRAELKTGKSVRVIFQISLHKKDKALLDQIRNSFRYPDQGGVEKVWGDDCFSILLSGSAASNKSPRGAGGAPGGARSGVYIFINLLNSKVYIGSSLNISKRFSQYSNSNYLERTTSMPICRALLKHGHENFSFSILEYCEEKSILEREGYYLNIL